MTKPKLFSLVYEEGKYIAINYKDFEIMGWLDVMDIFDRADALELIVSILNGDGEALKTLTKLSEQARRDYR